MLRCSSIRLWLRTTMRFKKQVGEKRPQCTWINTLRFKRSRLIRLGNDDPLGTSGGDPTRRRDAAADPSRQPMNTQCRRSSSIPPLPQAPGGSYLSELAERKWKTANSTQHLHAAHVSLDIKCNESHTSPVRTTRENDAAQMNLPASQLNVFTLHTPLWRRWCERLQVSGAGGGLSGEEPAATAAWSCECEWGDWKWELEPQLIGDIRPPRRGQGTRLIRYGPVHLRHWAAC